MPRPEETVFLKKEWKELKKHVKIICIKRGLTQMQALYEALQDWVGKHKEEK